MSNGLTTAELAQIRADCADLFPDTCDIMSNTPTVDDQGYPVDSWTAAYEDVACRVDYQTGKRATVGGAVVPYQKAIISMANDAVITTADRVLIDGVTFSIEAVNVKQSWIGVKRITAERIP